MGCRRTRPWPSLPALGDRHSGWPPHSESNSYGCPGRSGPPGLDTLASPVTLNFVTRYGTAYRRYRPGCQWRGGPGPTVRPRSRTAEPVTVTPLPVIWSSSGVAGAAASRHGAAPQAERRAPSLSSLQRGREPPQVRAVSGWERVSPAVGRLRLIT